MYDLETFIYVLDTSVIFPDQHFYASTLAPNRVSMVEDRKGDRTIMRVCCTLETSMGAQTPIWWSDEAMQPTASPLHVVHGQAL